MERGSFVKKKKKSKKKRGIVARVFRPNPLVTVSRDLQTLQLLGLTDFLAHQLRLFFLLLILCPVAQTHISIPSRAIRFLWCNEP